MKLSGYVLVMIISPYFSFIFSAARNSSSPCETVPVNMPILYVGVSVDSAVPSDSVSEPPHAANPKIIVALKSAAKILFIVSFSLVILIFL